MSRIIKAHETTEVVTTFDFRDILTGDEEKERKTGALQAGDDAADAAPEPEEEQVDPLLELEETIRNRLMEAEHNAQEIERDAYEKGYAQGRKDGYEYGKKSMDLVREHLEQLLNSVQEIPEKVFQDYRNWFIAACLTVLRQIIPGQMQAQPRAVAQLAQTVLDQAQEHHSLVMYLHPMDLELIEKHTDLKERLREEGRSFVLKPDPNMERGGCRAESDIQVVDATLSTQLDLIEEALRGGGAAAEETKEKERRSLVIRLHPADLEFLTNHTDLGELGNHLREEGLSFSLQPDPNVKRGAWRAEGDVQMMDDTLRTQMQLIEEALQSNGAVAEE